MVLYTNARCELTYSTVHWCCHRGVTYDANQLMGATFRMERTGRLMLARHQWVCYRSMVLSSYDDFAINRDGVTIVTIQMEESSGGVVLGVMDEYHTWLMWTPMVLSS